MRKLVSLFSVLMLASILVFAQNREITGRVTDEKGEALPGVTIRIKGSRLGAAADNDGSFKIKAKTGDILVITGAGLETTEVTVGSGDAISIVAKRSNGTLTEVVVTALGQQRQAKELGYATTKIKATELTQAKVVNLQNGLTGKVSGLNVQTVNNGVFADTRITLRGIRSLTGNNQPMLVLDGVPISLGYISSINPNDIVDVNVLKSASATAIYGPDGVNGAIVVTTKRGSKAKPSITVSHTIQLETVSFMPKFQTQFGSGSSVDAFGYGVYDPIENQGYGDAFDGSLRQIGRDAPDGSQYMVEYKARPKEKRKFFNTGMTNQTDVSFATGDFYLSAQNVDIHGILPKDVNKRQTIHMSANKEYNRFKASYTINYTLSNYDINAGSSFGNGRDYTPYWNLINTPMEIPVTRFKNWNKTYSDYGQNSNWWSTPDGFYNDYYYNPYWTVDNFRGVGRSDDFLGNIELNYKVAPWMNITYRLGATVTSAFSKYKQSAYTYGDFAKASGKSVAQSGDIPSAVSDATAFSSRLTSELFATFRKEIQSFKFDLLVGQSFRESQTKSVGVGTSNLGIPSVYNVVARKGEPSASESNSKNRLERFFGRLSVGYNNWAFLEATGSYDIDSRLANPYNYNSKDISFFYPGVSASLILSEAISEIKNSNVISYLKLRGAVSKTGNVNLGTYSLENTFGNGSYFPFGTLLGYTASNTLVRDKYKPEFVINKEVGFDIGLLKNRINLEATAYTQDNTNQIITVAYSQATGYGNALLNAASFTNKGIEADLKLTPLIKINKVSIDFKVNYTYTTNKVTKLIEGVNELGIGNGNYIIVGKPAYTFKLTDYVRDDQGHVIVDRSTGLPTMNPVTQVFGQTLPKHLLGLNLDINWKEFSFSAVADYRTGNQIYSGIGPDMDFSGISYRSGQNARQPFIFPNSVYDDGTGKYVTNSDVYTTGGYNFWSQSVNTSVNSNYLSSGAFWKLREVALTYTLPSKMFNNKTIKGISVSITGRNLITWLPKTNEWTDPEFSNTTGNAQGVNDRNNTPPTRIFGGNVVLQF